MRTPAQMTLDLVLATLNTLSIKLGVIPQRPQNSTSSSFPWCFRLLAITTMSCLPPDFPKMPRSVDGQVLPDFMNAKIIERNVKLPVPVNPGKYDFSIKKSDHFGALGGEEFDEGATWFPLQFVHWTCSNLGLGSYRGHYAQGATAIYGSLHPNEHKVALDEDEHIKGISGTYTDRVTSLQIHTTKTTHKVGHEAGKPFKFEVPEDHHVIGFHGRSDDHIRAIGVSYSKRLDSIVPPARASFVNAAALASTSVVANDAPGPSPDIKPMYSNIYLDRETKALWAANNMAAIEQKRNQAKNDLQPVYDNIKRNGETAWTLVEADGQRYYMSWTANASVWTYVNDVSTRNATFATTADQPKTKTSIISVGSYSIKANILGLSGYIWDNIPITLVASAIGLTFAILLRGLIADGVAWGIQFAATQLASAAAAAGLEELALMVPASVATGGGLIIAGLVGIGLFLAVMALSSVLFKKYYLTVNVFNFDPAHKWNSVQWHSDNANISNGQWKTESIDKFTPAKAGVTPPGFKPVQNIDNVVTFLSMAFTNDSTFLEGLGIGMLFARDDSAVGLALKYNLRRFRDNEIGVMGISGTDPNRFDLKGYYKGNWVESHSATSNVATLPITAHTPYLSGAPKNAYEFNVNIGLPV